MAVAVAEWASCRETRMVRSHMTRSSTTNGEAQKDTDLLLHLLMPCFSVGME